MSADVLLIELLTEELPPKSLQKLSLAFANNIKQQLLDYGLVDEQQAVQAFATPRRLGVQIEQVLAQGKESEQCEKLMPHKVAFDDQGNPTPTLLKKLSAKNIPVEKIQQFELLEDGKQQSLFYRHMVAGAILAEVLAEIVQEAVKSLPIAKLMRWGNGEAQFVRPVHRLVMLHGDQVIAGQVLGLSANRHTLGHRFLAKSAITLTNAQQYTQVLEQQGCVIVEFDKRKHLIEQDLLKQAQKLNASLGDYQDLLDEVTALVEYPAVYVGQFESIFLAVPQECLILTMRSNQKYFPLFDQNGKLMPHFLIVSNMPITHPEKIIAGNQRVVRPRLADARFFYEQDIKQGLEMRLPLLKKVVYHNKLGSQYLRVERIQALAQKIAEQLGIDCNLAQRAASLSKADLVSDMVGEFPELQGVMGKYYALHDGEDPRVAEAICEHYRPRFSGDQLPESLLSASVALADKLDVLCGLFALGQIPTGDKDPFGLRRAMLGVLRILHEKKLPLDLSVLFTEGLAQIADLEFDQEVALNHLSHFAFDRLRTLLRDQGFEGDVVDAVLSLKEGNLEFLTEKLEAVKHFKLLPEAVALSAANKRIANILRKVDTQLDAVIPDLLTEPAEHILFERLSQLTPEFEAALNVHDYRKALTLLAKVKQPVDTFFDQVMVMSEDASLRQNRLSLLNSVFNMTNSIADIARLS